jgi:hypothetical protein
MLYVRVEYSFCGGGVAPIMSGSTEYIFISVEMDSDLIAAEEVDIDWTMIWNKKQR